MIGLFVDVNNMYENISKRFPGKMLDYEKYIDDIEDQFGKLTRSIAYGIKLESSGNGFFTALKNLDYEVKYKIRDRSSWTDKLKQVSWDVGIALDVYNIIETQKINTVILGSATRNIADLVQFMCGRGVKTIIYACCISQELKRAASSWIEIPESILRNKEIKNEITAPTE